MSSTTNNSSDININTVETSETNKTTKSNKKTSGWRWFIGMYFVSLIALGSFHAFSHYFAAWLNSF